MPFSSSRPDRLTWSFDKDGIYSTNLGHVEWMKHENGAYLTRGEPRWKWVWCVDVTPKIRLFFWRVMRGILPMCVNMIRI